jgi:hypothetical protein
LQDDGWVLRQEIVLVEAKSHARVGNGPLHQIARMVFLLTKSASYAYDAQAIAEVAAVSVEDWKPAGGQNRNDASTTLRNDGDRHGGGQLGRPGTRNRRSVWTIATAPFSEAHFATFPPELPSFASARGRASAAAARIAGRGGRGWWSAYGGTYAERKALGVGGPYNMKPEDYQTCGSSQSIMKGWSPSCSCPPHEPVPATCLDPFAGAGTTGLVADRLGRNAILIELNPEYAAMARNPPRSGRRHVRLSGGRGMSFMVAVAEPQTAEELYALYKRVLARRYNPGVFKSAPPKPAFVDVLGKRREEKAAKEAAEAAQAQEIADAIAAMAKTISQLLFARDVLIWVPSLRGLSKEQADQFLKEVQKVTGRSANDLKSERRNAGTVRARHILFWVTKEFTHVSLPQIGRRFGRDHTTVLNGIRRVQRVIDRIGPPKAEKPTVAEWAEHLWAADWTARL